MEAQDFNPDRSAYEHVIYQFHRWLLKEKEEVASKILDPMNISLQDPKDAGVNYLLNLYDLQRINVVIAELEKRVKRATINFLDDTIKEDK